jgi:HYR domain
MMIVRLVVSIFLIFVILLLLVISNSTPISAGPNDTIKIHPKLHLNLSGGPKDTIHVPKCWPNCPSTAPTITIKSEEVSQGGHIEAQKDGRYITFLVTPKNFPGKVNVHCGDDSGTYGTNSGYNNNDEIPFTHHFKHPNDTPITVECTGNNIPSKPFTFTYDDTQTPYFKKSSQLIEREATGIQTTVDFKEDVKNVAKDNVDQNLEIDCVPESGSMFALGTNTVECVAEDDRGLKSGKHPFEIYVSDKTAPTLYVPPDISAVGTTSSGAIVYYNVSANDLVDGQLQPTCSHLSGSQFPFGATQVTCSATDSSHYPKANSISNSFYVTVGDSSVPTIDLVSEPEVKPGQSGLIVIYSVKGIDKIDGTIPVECNPPSGSEFQPGTTTIKCTASDSHRNNATKIITFSY